MWTEHVCSRSTRAEYMLPLTGTIFFHSFITVHPSLKCLNIAHSAWRNVFGTSPSLLSSQY